jgi:hypothetical protein
MSHARQAPALLEQIDGGEVTLTKGTIDSIGASVERNLRR